MSFSQIDQGAGGAALVLHLDGHQCTDPYAHPADRCSGFGSAAEAMREAARSMLARARVRLETAQAAFEALPGPEQNHDLQDARVDYDEACRQLERLKQPD
jgi:hypothetical protein